MLTKNVNGVDVTLTDEEEAEVRAQWAANAPVPPTLEELKAAKLTTLSDACQSAIYAGFDSSALGTVHHYPALDKDQRNLIASVLDSLLPNLPADWTTPFWCRDAEGTWFLAPHTASQIQQVGQDAKAAILACITRNADLVNQVNDPSTDQTALDAIVW